MIGAPQPGATAAPLSETETKTWQLLAPDWAALDTVWHHDSPFVLWPVGNQPLLAHWMDEAVRRGVQLVELYVADRPAEIRAWIENGAYWSRRVQLIPIGTERQAPSGVERIDHLPGLPPPPIPEVERDLPRFWFDLQKQWLAERCAETVTIDRQLPSGGWVGPGVRIHPSVHLTAPFWIGARVRIGPGCEIGPNALIAEGAVLDDSVQVEDACVLPRTYLGRNTRLFQSAAAEDVLLDFRRGCRVVIEEAFIMGPVAACSFGPGIFGRVLALCCYLVLAPFLRLCSEEGREVRRIRWHAGDLCDLTTGRRGPLWFRRAHWLRHIATGRLRWIGILPRGPEELAQVPEETARVLRKAPAGVFSLADVYGCHEPADPEEWIHAAYQASAAGKNAGSVVLRNLWKIAWSRTTQSSPA